MAGSPNSIYRFTMSPAGTWSIDADRMTYTGPSLMETQFRVDGETIILPAENLERIVSFTLPPLPAGMSSLFAASPVPDIPMVPSATPAAPSAPAASGSRRPMRVPRDWNGPYGPGPVWLDYIIPEHESVEDFITGTAAAEPSGIQKGFEETETMTAGIFTEQLRDELLCSAFDSDEEMEDSGSCHELIDIKDSPEVVSLLSDSSTDEDPSEGSDAPASSGD